MRYEGRIFRPPSEADALILQATIGCSWNHCTYCDMYRDKTFRARPVEQTLADIEEARRTLGPAVEKVFLADGDALVLPTEDLLRIVEACFAAFPRLRRVSTYATARNVLDKTDEALARLAAAGLRLLYMGPESGDDDTLRRIAKGASAADHVEAARRAHRAKMTLSVIFLLGIAGRARSQIHAAASARLATAMDPAFVSLLTVTVLPGTPLATLEARGRFEQATVRQTLEELRTFVAEARPTDALFRTNHASNHLPLGGRLPRDRARILAVVDAALAGRVPLRPAWARGL